MESHRSGCQKCRCPGHSGARHGLGMICACHTRWQVVLACQLLVRMAMAANLSIDVLFCLAICAHSLVSRFYHTSSAYVQQRFGR